jgi:glyoxylase I family protein
MQAVQHMSFGCVDRLKQEAFYTRFFGFRRVRVFKPGTPDEFVMLRLGNVCIEFFGNNDGVTTAPGPLPVGFRHLAFEVPDLNAKVAEMSAAGIAMGEIVDCNALVPGMRVCFFKDPEGNELELMEGWQEEKNPPAYPTIH